MEKSPFLEADDLSASQKYLAFYGTRRFIFMFARSFLWSLSRARWIQLIVTNNNVDKDDDDDDDDDNDITWNV